MSLTIVGNCTDSFVTSTTKANKSMGVDPNTINLVNTILWIIFLDSTRPTYLYPYYDIQYKGGYIA